MEKSGGDNIMKLNIKKYIQKTILVRLVAYFILTITITLLASSYFTYNYFSTTFKEEITDVNNKLLNQLSIFSDEFILKNINELALNVIMDKTRYSDIALLFNEITDNKTGILLDAQNELKSIVFSNREIIDSIFINSRINNILVSSTFVQYIDGKSIAESDEFNWINSFYEEGSSLLRLKTRNTKIYSDSFGDRGDIITVICSYPISSVGKDVEGCIAINIKEQVLNQYLVKFNSANFGQIIIIDDSGAIVSHSDKSSLYKDISSEPFVKGIFDQNNAKGFISLINKEEHVVSFVRSKYNNWYYVSLVPTRIFYQRDFLIKQKILIISIIILIIVFIFTNIFSFKIYIPFRKIIDKYILSAGSSGVMPKNINEYKLLDNMFNNMTIKINDLQETLIRNSLMIRHNFLSNLINNRINRDEIEKLMKLSNIKFSKPYYCVVILTMSKAVIDSHQPDKIQIYKYSVLDFINSLTNEESYYCPIATYSTTISIIVNTDINQSYIIKNFINEVQRFCFENFKFYLTAAMGSFAVDLSHINRSYVDALVCLQYRFIYPQENIFYFDDVSKVSNYETALPCDFTDVLDKNLRLMNFIEIKKILSEFLFTTKEINISYRQVKKELSKLIAIYKNYLVDMNINFDEIVDDTVKNKLSLPNSIDEFIETFLQVIHISFDYISSKKINKNSELVEMVKQYVINNLNAEVSLNSAAGAVHMSTYYLSKIFKEETGINFIDFLVKCKIEKAKELLATTDLSIEKITNLTGYSHVTYFSRKFKELTGKAPSVYRNEMIVKSKE